MYQNSIRSYRELPLRFYEYGVVHRHEKSGVLHGLLRVREFTQDDAHIFCRPEQIENEVNNILRFTHKIMNAFGFSYEMELSTRPEQSIGEDSVWESATLALQNALASNNISYQVDEGGGAFYGPKIDIKITDAIGRKWQCGTIQIDMNLPERFNLSYIDENNEHAMPVMIHRAILGSFERFVAILTEHFGGEFPFFIAPTQVIIIPINESHVSMAQNLQNELRLRGIYAELSLKCRFEVFSKNSCILISYCIFSPESIFMRLSRIDTLLLLSSLSPISAIIGTFCFSAVRIFLLSDSFFKLNSA